MSRMIRVMLTLLLWLPLPVSAAPPLSSQGVNHVTCVSDGASVVWLGTEHGIKRLDSRTGRIRLYGCRDGLPGNVTLAVTADGPGAWALVWARPNTDPNLYPAYMHLHSPEEPGPKTMWSYDGPVILCHLTRPNGRWQRVRKLTLPPSWSYWHDGGVNGYVGPRKAFLATTGRYVCLLISPSFDNHNVAASFDSNLFTVYDKQTGQFRDIPSSRFSARLRDDFLQTAFVLAHGSDFWIGTTEGEYSRIVLLRYGPLSDKITQYEIAPKKTSDDTEIFWPLEDGPDGAFEGDACWMIETTVTVVGPNEIRNWNLVRLTPRTGQIQVFLSKTAPPRPHWHDWPPEPRRTVCLAWVGEAPSSGLAANFWQVDPQTGSVRRYGLKDWRHVPLPLVRRLAARPLGMPYNASLAAFFASRLPGWGTKKRG